MSTEESDAVVIDNGTLNIKCGFGGDDAPRGFFRTALGRPKAHVMNVMANNVKLHVGEDAQRRASILDLVNPICDGRVEDWDGMTSLWDHVFNDQLFVDPQDQPVLLTEPATRPKANREKMTRIMFEDFKVPALFIQCPAILSAYASGCTSGVVLDCGESVTSVVPLYEGYALPHAIRSLQVSGQQLTEYHMRLLRFGHLISSNRAAETARRIKHALGYVASDFDTAAETAEEQIYELPDGNKIPVGDVRFQVPEALFKPSLIGLNETPGIHEAIVETIDECDIDIRAKLYEGIVTTGGSTMFRGLDQRLETEIKSLAPSSLGEKMKIIDPVCDRKDCLAWIGGSVAACLDRFQTLWVTKEEYEEVGVSIVHRKCY